MSFSSLRYLAFLAGVLLLLKIVRSNDVRKRVLGIASCLFYAAWDWRYLGLLLSISVIDYVAAIQIDRSQQQSRRRWWLWMSIGSNLGILAYFKYANFFLDNVNALSSLTGFSVPAAQILLPAGISFYTFKTMSYTIDVYRREIAPCRTWIDYVTFVTFFPELIAGPIVRASVLLPQMERPIGPTWDRLAVGSAIFLQGLTKKLLIADRLADVVDPIFQTPGLFSTATIWCGVVAYAIQIYCDFSGYSDMAIGSARMVGYELPVNFRMPYLSLSVTEFWRRWHITLSEWLRDYLYIPLGGNRQGLLRSHLNLAATMLLGGLWHGGSWTFVFWGAMHAVALIVHKTWTRAGLRMPAPLAWATTLLFIAATWVPFRAGSLAQTQIILTKMIGVSSSGLDWFPLSLWFCITACVAGHAIGSLIESRNLVWSGARAALLRVMGLRIDTDLQNGRYLTWNRVTFAGAYAFTLWLAVLLLFSPLNSSPFIYFQF